MNRDKHGWLAKLRGVFFFFVLLASHFSLLASEPWQDALDKMPLRAGVTHLTKTNAVEVMLEAFQENDAAKALILMPGATDELYFFNRGNATITNTSPTLLDAVNALTNQTLIHVTFHAPFILLHSTEDPLEPLYKIEDEKTFERIRKKKFTPDVLYQDRDWDSILPALEFHLNTKVVPELHSYRSNHFYRNSFAAHNLDGFEILEALAFAGKTQFTIEKKKVLFEGDKRFRARPKVPENFEPIKELTR